MQCLDMCDSILLVYHHENGQMIICRCKMCVQYCFPMFGFRMHEIIYEYFASRSDMNDK